MIKKRAIINVLFALLIFLGGSLLFPAIVAWIYGGPDVWSFVETGIGCIIVGAFGFALTRLQYELRPKEGFVIVTFGWLLFAGIGAIPFVLTEATPSYTDAFFETMSGFTTTGATILTDIEKLPHGVLFWRSFTHWLGGMGIILLSLAILPLLGVGGMQLFKAEVPGPSPDKLSPRIKETAKMLWVVYFLLTFIETMLLWWAGMSFFDAVCHAFGTLATGGFSTKNASIGHYNNPIIDYIIILFMIFAGTNFALHYRALQGKILYYWKDPEVRVYLGIIAVGTLIVGIAVWFHTEYGLADNFRHSLFQVVSILTTTGYGTSDYELWGVTVHLLLFIFMFIGGCAGSTAGGMKIIRPLVLFKFSRAEVLRLIHPQAVIPVRIGSMVIPHAIIATITGFFLFYMALFVVGTLFMSMLGLDLATSLGSVAATIGNIGPGLGDVGPTDNFSHIPKVGKWVLSFLMLAGRLEVFTVIILFSRSFWRR
ncbi:MAG: TrkH family potassium uptake protein [Deferribacteres bacterium]|nr:TrkH family potassium uptake protein [candidate division KSB1 bacterium]MCB9503434.1 TrkH family potassium uptake protein [Deferribacteres bacterium]